MREYARASGATVVMAAHRPAAITAADHILHLPDPAGAGEGSPAAPAPGSGPDVRPARADGSADRRSGRGPDPAASPPARTRTARLAAAGIVAGAAANLFDTALTATGAVLIVLAAAHPPLLALSIPIVLVRLFALGRPVLRYLERLLTHDAALATLTALRVGVWRRLVPRVPGPRLPAGGDLLTRLARDVDDQADGTVRGPWAAASGLTGITAATLVVVLTNPPAGIVLLLGVLLTVGWGLLLGLAGQQRTAREVRMARGHRAAGMVEVLAAGADLAGNGIDGTALIGDREQRYRTAVRRQSVREALTDLPVALVAGVLPGAVAMTLSATHPAVVATGAHALIAAIVLGSAVLGEQAQALAAAGTAIRLRSEARSRLAAVTSGAVGSIDPSAPAAAPAGHRPATLRFDDVHASWSVTTPTLVGVDLQLSPGARTAVTGSSGSGKSTLAATALHLLDPARGSIRLADTNYSRLGGDQVRGSVGAIGLADHVFALTVRENLTLGEPGIGDGDIMAVLGLLRLLPWIATLPEGLDTALGGGGVIPSGGQAVRLAAGRALLRRPGLLVLDEPTECLDVPTARDILTDLAHAHPEQSWLLLSHRTEGLDLVETIVELRAGVLIHDRRTARQDHPRWPESSGD